MKNIVYIKGNGNSGKSNFRKNFYDQYNIIVDCFDTDVIVSEMISDLDVKNTYLEDGQYRFDKYIRSDFFDVDLFITKLFQQIKNFNKNLILIEGYTLLFYYDKIVSKLNEKYTNIYDLEMGNTTKWYLVKYKNTIYEVTEGYDEVFKILIKDFCQNILGDLYDQINYQCFDMLGFDCTNSVSPEKYVLSKLENYIKEDDKFLDIGCNDGYFCFKVSKKIKNKIVGIDFVKPSIDKCNQLNSKVFCSKNIKFICDDVIKHNFEDTFNIIFSASVFHYFRDDQQLFIDKMYNILEDDGLLFLEVEHNPNIGLLKLSRLKNEEPCYFPDVNLFMGMIKNKFSVIENNLSVKQKGSPNNRYFYILKKNK